MKLFYVDLELNVPAFFSSLLMLVSAGLLGIISLFKFRERTSFKWHWAILAIGFLFMSFDEIIAVHERFIEPVRAMFGDVQFGVLYFAWVIPAIFLVIVIGLGFVRFLMELPRSSRTWFLLAAALFLGGAIGFELLEGQHAEIFGKDNLTYMVMTSIEEGLEMGGVIVFIGALLAYLEQGYETIQIGFAREQEQMEWQTPKLQPNIDRLMKTN